MSENKNSLALIIQSHGLEEHVEAVLVHVDTNWVDTLLKVCQPLSIGWFCL